MNNEEDDSRKYFACEKFLRDHHPFGRDKKQIQGENKVFLSSIPYYFIILYSLLPLWLS